MSDTTPHSRVAVLLRAEADTPKVRHSLAQLTGSTTYDLYVLAHEEPGGEMDFGAIPKLSYTRQLLAELGFPAGEPGFLQHCADAVFAFVQQQRPGYDWYVFVDQDVLIRPTAPGYFDRLAAELAGRPEGTLDAVAPRVRGADAGWFWHAAAAQRYGQVMRAMTPVLALSRRALSHLVSERLKEVQGRAGSREHPRYPADLTFVDAFVASAIVARGYALIDLETLLPGSYTPETFNRQQPRPMGGEPPEAPPALAFPVLDDGAFLERRFSESARAACLDRFLSDLEAPAWPVAPAVLREFQDRVFVRASGHAEPQPPGRVAVLLRTHVDSATVRAGLAELGRGTHYDLYVLAREEPGREMDFGPVPKLSHSMQTFREMGYEIDDPNLPQHLSDLLFGFAQEQAPGYDWYVLVEYDVLIRPAEPGYFDQLAQRLAGQPSGALDFVAPQLMFSTPDWGWRRPVARAYPRVLSSFFPLVAVSGRAIPFLLAERRKEAARARAAGRPLTCTSEPDSLMFCEGFIASALWAGGYRVTDLNQFMPGSYTFGAFNVGPPRLTSEEERSTGASLAHPVLHDREFLEKHLGYSWRTGTLESFASDLRGGRWSTIPAPLLQEFEQRAMAMLAALKR